MSEGYYGRHGMLGLATPQANPTAETEFRALLPAGVACATIRMVSADSNPDARLRNYFVDIARTLEGFDTLSMQAIGLACTGSSYLLGHYRVEGMLAELSEHREHPIVSAAAAIEGALRRLSASSIALACPYPAWLLEAADAHWQSRGFHVVDQWSLDPTQGDTRSIYGLSPEVAAREMKSRWRNVQADAYLITGTGLPTLRAVAELSQTLPGPVLSSNLCLAWATLEAAGVSPAELAPTAKMPLIGGWEGHLERL